MTLLGSPDESWSDAVLCSSLALRLLNHKEESLSIFNRLGPVAPWMFSYKFDCCTQHRGCPVQHHDNVARALESPPFIG